MVVLNIFHVLIAIAMVALVLVQKGAGATAGAAFGSGASGTVFGSRGAGNFLTKSTWVLATLFCTISLVMAVVVSRSESSPSVDLGVVSSAVTEDAAGKQELAAPDSAEHTIQLDVPSVEAVEEEAGNSALLQEQQASDLPPLGEEESDSADGEAGGDASAAQSDES